MSGKEEGQYLKKKLIKVQSELKAPKGQHNTFGNYKYRSAEDILEAVKPLVHKEGMAIHLSDEAVQVGEWNYIKAVAYISDASGYLYASGFARETEAKKGMDASQITGSASSYARKYALNGLFAIDDTKDADTDEQRNQASKPSGLDEAKSDVFAEFKKQGVSDSTEMIGVIDSAIGKASIRTVEDANKVLEFLKKK